MDCARGFPDPLNCFDPGGGVGHRISGSARMLLLNAFSRPLHVPLIGQWVLIIGVVVPIGLCIHYNNRLKEGKDRSIGSS
jgi:hypothetical protein